MKLTIEIDNDEITELVKEMVAKRVAKEILEQYHDHRSSYCYHNAIKEAVREAIKKDIDNLSDKAVQAASVSITNKAFKKMSAEDILKLMTEKG